MKSFWMVAAGVCIVIAPFFIWRRNFDTAFLIAVAGAVAWFLNYRMQLKRITAEADAERARSTEEDDEQS